MKRLYRLFLFVVALYSQKIDANSKFKFPFNVKVIAAGKEPGFEVPWLVGKTVKIIGLHWGVSLEFGLYGGEPVDCVYQYICTHVQKGKSTQYIHQSSLDTLPRSAFLCKRVDRAGEGSDREDDIESEDDEQNGGKQSSFVIYHSASESPRRWKSPNLRVFTVQGSKPVVEFRKKEDSQFPSSSNGVPSLPGYATQPFSIRNNISGYFNN